MECRSRMLSVGLVMVLGFLPGCQTGRLWQRAMRSEQHFGGGELAVHRVFWHAESQSLWMEYEVMEGASVFVRDEVPDRGWAQFLTRGEHDGLVAHLRAGRLEWLRMGIAGYWRGEKQRWRGRIVTKSTRFAPAAELAFDPAPGLVAAGRAQLVAPDHPALSRQRSRSDSVPLQRLELKFTGIPWSVAHDEAGRRHAVRFEGWVDRAALPVWDLGSAARFAAAAPDDESPLVNPVFALGRIPTLGDRTFVASLEVVKRQDRVPRAAPSVVGEAESFKFEHSYWNVRFHPGAPPGTRIEITRRVCARGAKVDLLRRPSRARLVAGAAWRTIPMLVLDAVSIPLYMLILSLYDDQDDDGC